MATTTELSGKKLAKALVNVCIGFGPISANEVCYLAGLPADIALDNLDSSDFAALEVALNKFQSSINDTQELPTVVLDVNQKVLAIAACPLIHLLNNTGTKHISYQSVSELLEATDKFIGSYKIPEQERYQKIVHNSLERAREKYHKLQQELAEAATSEQQKIIADNLMTYQYQYKDHNNNQIVVPNIYSDNGELLNIDLDRKLTIVQNMQSYYKRYDKLKRAQNILKDQLQKCADSITYLETVEASLTTSTTSAEIADIRDELIISGYLKEPPRKKNRDKISKPFSFTAPDGTQILVGKNNYQNDALTFKTADKNDIWLHAKDIPGSHVIVRSKVDMLSNNTLELAAKLAAYFSKARNSSNVPVDYTQIRYVKKPSGAKPGFVIFTNHTTVFVTPHTDELKTFFPKNLI